MGIYIIERNSKRIFLQVVPERSSTVLFEICSSHLKYDTKIYSDCWRGYSLLRIHFDVRSLNHKLNFVDPNNRNMHTQNIERLWRSVKKEMIGVSSENYNPYLKLFMFEEMC
jgi:transposase